MAENPFKLLEDDEELQALQSICTKADKNTFFHSFQKKLFKIGIRDMMKEKQTQINNLQKNKEATIASNTMMTAEIEEASKSCNNMVAATENIRVTNTSYMKDLILSTEYTSKITRRLENDKNKCDDLTRKIKEKYDKMPLVQEWRETINEEKVTSNAIKEKENIKNALILDIKRIQNEVAELDKQSIVELSKFMIEEQPKLRGNIKEKLIEKEKLKKQILEKKQKQSLVSQKISKIEKQPMKMSLSLLQNMQSDLISTTRDLSAMWKKKHAILTKVKKSEDVKEDLFSSSYMKYFNSNHSTFKANANKQHLIDILDDLKSAENEDKSKVSDHGTNNPTLSKTKVLDYGNQKLDQVERNTQKFKDVKLLDDGEVSPNQFQDNYKSQGDTTTKSKLTTQEKNPIKKIKGEKVTDIEVASKKFKASYESKGDAATKYKDEDVAMIIEVPYEKIQHSKEEGKKPTEPSKLKMNDNFFANCYMQYFSTKYSPAKGSVQKENEINILEDIPVDKSQMEEIISKLNVNTLQPVEVIEVTRAVKEPTSVTVKKNEGADDIIKEIPESIIPPPTMFIDSSQTQNVSNEAGAQEIEIMDTQNCENDDESYTKDRKLLLQSLNLENTPDFVYAKNSSLHKEFTTSKYFTREQIEENKDRENVNNNETQKEVDKIENVIEVNNILKDFRQIATETINKGVEDNQQIVYKTKALPNKTAQLEGFSPNESMNTTMDEMDSSHCIDSNLLLSPKADVEQNMEEPSNFLTAGKKKPEMSFFGNMLGNDTSEPESNTQNPGFNFNFGGSGDKKKGGNLFNFF